MSGVKHRRGEGQRWPNRLKGEADRFRMENLEACSLIFCDSKYGLVER